jgi:hypothetical protein
MLAVAALMVAWTLTASGAALTGPLLQDSPIAPQEQLSPLPTAAPTVEPTQSPAQAATPTPPPSALATAESPLPMAVLIGVMAVIGLAAVIIGLQRR